MIIRLLQNVPTISNTMVIMYSVQLTLQFWQTDSVVLCCGKLKWVNNWRMHEISFTHYCRWLQILPFNRIHLNCTVVNNRSANNETGFYVLEIKANISLKITFIYGRSQHFFAGCFLPFFFALYKTQFADLADAV